MEPGARREEQEPGARRQRAPTALTMKCGVCYAPAPDHIHFGGQSVGQCRVKMSSLLDKCDPPGSPQCNDWHSVTFSKVLLLLQGVLQAESHEAGEGEVQVQWGGLSGHQSGQEVCGLQVQEVSPHRDGPLASPGERPAHSPHLVTCSCDCNFSRGQETDNERRRQMMEITRTERSHNPRLNTPILLRAALTSVRWWEAP